MEDGYSPAYNAQETVRFTQADRENGKLRDVISGRDKMFVGLRKEVEELKGKCHRQYLSYRAVNHALGWAAACFRGKSSPT